MTDKSARPWIVRMKGFCAHMTAHGWGSRGPFIMFGQLFWIVGLPVPWQARDADNDNLRESRP